MEQQDVFFEYSYVDLNYLYAANPACYLLYLFDQEEVYAPYIGLEPDLEDVPIVPSKAPPKAEDSLDSWRMFCQKQRLISSDTSNKETEMTPLRLT